MKKETTRITPEWFMAIVRPELLQTILTILSIMIKTVAKALADEKGRTKKENLLLNLRAFVTMETRYTEMLKENKGSTVIPATFLPGEVRLLRKMWNYTIRMDEASLKKQKLDKQKLDDLDATLKELEYVISRFQ